jgi:hypothetical protein
MTDRSNELLSQRRAFLGQGLGIAGLASVLADDGLLAAPQDARTGHARGRAKQMIFLHMVGAPSQLDLFDNKPMLRKHHGRECPAELLEGQRFAFLGARPKLMGSPFSFRRHGESGLELSELLPGLGSVADEVSLIKTVYTSEFNHGPAQVFAQTGFGQQGRPSLGSWLSYGLGSLSRDLPAYVVLVTGLTPGGGSSLWGNGFLPSVHQGVRFRAQGDPVLYASNPKGVDRPTRGRIIDDVVKLNRLRLSRVGDPEIATRIANYELAYRMQTAVPGLMDLSQETRTTLEQYGASAEKPSFANNCLLARRLIERGVRVVQLFDQGWDHHGGIGTNLPRKAAATDRPIAALIADLRQRGLLDETLVVFGAEFGRTPMLQGDRATAGRDHHKEAFSYWLAGGGVRGGQVIGKTDDLGYYPVEDPVEIHDLHATILQLLGLDHEQLTYRYQGREFRLTDVSGRVMQQLF